MKLSVLIAHSDRKESELLRQACLENGLRAETATGGVECLTKLHKIRPDVVVLEQNLPWGGSDGVLTVMRDLDVSSRTPVILIYDQPDEVPTELLQRPVVFLLWKPYRFSALMECIHAAAEVSGRAPIEYGRRFVLRATERNDDGHRLKSNRRVGDAWGKRHLMEKPG
jgi:DNA-binding response OmpR family regulator